MAVGGQHSVGQSNPVRQLISLIEDRCDTTAWWAANGPYQRRPRQLPGFEVGPPLAQRKVPQYQKSHECEHCVVQTS